MTEQDGGALLKEAFEKAGLAITENHPLDEDGLSVVLDGFDPARRVGYELITTEAGDRAEFGAEVVARLEARIARGELWLLLVDEREVTEAGLRLAAERFLARLKKQGVLP